MTAPICATSLAGPSRSSRAISEAWRLAGTAMDGEGIAAKRHARWQLSPVCLQHRLGHFLDEQRDAIGALDDVLPGCSRGATCCR